ncbi:MAG: HDOD domain-containing protein [Woeseia sp.]|nr:HDOD domain-containing protein [Woeseia sp.]NNE59266.1 HDOD domain-containing protein [Woeseia sp.]NNL55036.1 HDOD domain-containing protein [Woeseia sp.]
MSAEAMQTAAGFVQQLAGDLNRGNLELPMFPDSVVRIQQAFQAAEVDIDEIIQIISSDPVLAARVLQLSNSSALRGTSEITDVRQAVIRMGYKMVQGSVIGFALRQAERNDGLSAASRENLKSIWQESVELAARCYVIAKKYTKLSADEALLTGLLSVIGRLYIFLKSEEYGAIDYAELDTILADWHPAIAKAIAENWGMPEELVVALESQLDTDPPLRETASLAEVLSAARLLLQHETSGDALDAGEYPLLQRLGIADKGESAVTLDEHAEAIDGVRQGLRG